MKHLQLKAQGLSRPDAAFEYKNKAKEALSATFGEQMCGTSVVGGRLVEGPHLQQCGRPQPGT